MADVPSKHCYAIGRGKPPKEHQFKPGQSGNPKGRPKRATKNFAEELLSELNQHIVVKENGKPRKVTKQRALIMATLAGAIRGKPTARRDATAWMAHLRVLDYPPLENDEDEPM